MPIGEKSFHINLNCLVHIAYITAIAIAKTITTSPFVNTPSAIEA